MNQYAHTSTDRWQPSYGSLDTDGVMHSTHCSIRNTTAASHGDSIGDNQTELIAIFAHRAGKYFTLECCEHGGLRNTLPITGWRPTRNRLRTDTREELKDYLGGLSLSPLALRITTVGDT